MNNWCVYYIFEKYIYLLTFSDAGINLQNKIEPPEDSPSSVYGYSGSNVCSLILDCAIAVNSYTFLLRTLADWIKSPVT